MKGKTVAVAVIAATIILLVVALVVGGSYRFNGGGMMGGFGPGMSPWYGGAMMLGGILMMLAVLAVPVLVILGFVWLVVALGRGSAVTPGANAQTPLEILKARYARGEITNEQYDELRQHLAV